MNRSKLFLILLVLFVALSGYTQGVGINQTSPVSMLDVNGNVTIGTGASYSGNTAAPANGAIIEGNVGIGTSTVSGPLDVRGDSPANFFADWTTEGNSIRNVIRLVRTYDGGAGADGIGARIAFQVETETEGTNEITGYIVADASDATAGTIDSDMSLWNVNNGTPYERVTIQSDGEVGIGTDDPQSILHLYGSTAQIGFNDTDNADEWFAGMSNSNSNFIISEVGTGEVEITIEDATGFVGIATTDPEYELHVSGGASAANILVDGTGAGVILRDNDGTADEKTAQQYIASGKVWRLRALDNSLVETYDGISFHMGNGFVGVGTSVPGFELHVSGTGAAQVATVIDNLDNTAGSITLLSLRGTGTSGTSSGMGRIVAGKDQQWTSTASTRDGYLTLDTRVDNNMTERVRITSDGYVGVGTTGSAGMLSVYDASGSNVLFDLEGTTDAIAMDLDAYLNPTGTALFMKIEPDYDPQAANQWCYGTSSTINVRGATSNNVANVYNYHAQARLLDSYGGNVSNYFGFRSAGVIVNTSSGSPTLSNYVGFYAKESATAGSNRNAGFQGVLNDAANTWNLYMDGTADNYLEGKLGLGTASPATSAALEISSTTGALIVSRMTTTERNALTAVNGMIIYNTSTNAFNFYENGSWVTK